MRPCGRILSQPLDSFQGAGSARIEGTDHRVFLFDDHG
jgi:hypothetical protein